MLSRIMRWQYVNMLTNMEHAGREEDGTRDGTPEGLEPEDEEITGKPGEAKGDAGGEVGAGQARGEVAAGLPRCPV